jgi:hypothetical protein
VCKDDYFAFPLAEPVRDHTEKVLETCPVHWSACVPFEAHLASLAMAKGQFFLWLKLQPGSPTGTAPRVHYDLLYYLRGKDYGDTCYPGSILN